MLVENTLFEKIDKIKIAKTRLKEFEPEEGYLLAFSGGKDSIVIYDLAKKSGVKFESYMSMTTVDPPELLKFVKQNYPEIKLHRPEKSMYQLIIKNRFPPTRLVRYCCSQLKETVGTDRFLVTGVRWAESIKRRSRKMVEVCQKNKTKKFLHLIIDWSEREVWQYIKENNLKYCELYDLGRKRIGCIMCPMATLQNKLQDIKDYPRFYSMYLKAFEKILPYTQWKTANDLMKWWIYGRNNNKNYNEKQFSLFE